MKELIKGLKILKKYTKQKPRIDNGDSIIVYVFISDMKLKHRTELEELGFVEGGSCYTYFLEEDM